MTLFTRQHTVVSDLIYPGQIINLRVDTVTADGKTATREVIEHNGGVVILCQPHPDSLVFVKQYRYAFDKEIIELPAGRLNKDEVPLLAAQRELKEETGYEAKNWQERAQVYTAPGFCNEVLYFFYATDVTVGEKMLDEDEETEVMVLTIDQARVMVVNGDIADCKTIAGLALLKC